MNVSSTSSTPGNVGASTASSSNSSPYTDYLNGNQRAASSTRPTNNISVTNPSTDNQASSSKPSGSTSSLVPGLEPTTDHLQRLAQMTQGVGLVKNEGDSETSNSIVAAGHSSDALYQQTAIAAYAQQYGWQNYYQFGAQIAPGPGFPSWPPQCYPPGHWQNYAQTKKGRQTYQRYQTSVLESKFQQSSYVSKKQREELRVQTALTDRQIKIWFQNRRMKAKKEKNRCEDQSEHSTLLPSNNSVKSLNNSLSSLNGAGSANASNLMSGANLGMLGGQHLLNDEALIGLMENEDGKNQLKMPGLHGGGMMPNSTTTSPMWPTAHSVQAAAAGAINTDPINQWTHILPQGTHGQSNQYMQNPYFPYHQLCPPNI